MGNKTKLKSILSTDAIWVDYYNLYEFAFPEVERRSEDSLIKTLNNPIFHPNIILEDNHFVGLFNYWEFNTFFYLEHFAISPEKRNLGIGKVVLKQFQKDKTLVLECELPLDDSSKRRIQFYSKLGFNAFPFTYMQPPYSNDKEPIELLLLINNSNLNKSSFLEISSTIAQSVYQQSIQL